ncbi:MAG TPA: hypothetical protein VFZ10_06960, partial [Geminicoccaceae bacterium]
PSLRLQPVTIERARREHPGYDIDALVRAWQGRALAQGGEPRDSDRAFLAFCRVYTRRDPPRASIRHITDPSLWTGPSVHGPSLVDRPVTSRTWVSSHRGPKPVTSRTSHARKLLTKLTDSWRSTGRNDSN